MALKDEEVCKVLETYLEEGETQDHWDFGVKQPNIFLVIFLFCLAILPGIIGTALLTKYYLVGLTKKRFIVVQFSGKLNPKEMTEYKLGQTGAVIRSIGGLFTHINIEDKEKQFVAKFHRMGMKNNRDHSNSIAKLLNPSHQG
jgi:hypothetical protein